MEHIWEFRYLILEGASLTVSVAISSLLLSVILGLIGAWAKLSKSKIANNFAVGYTTTIRGIPDLVLMLLIFYGGQQFLNDFGHRFGLWGYVDIPHFAAGVITIGFIFGAYMTETFRGAILAIPNGQIEAGIACGMSRFTIFIRITWPQMVRYALPSFTNNWMIMIKATALVSVLGLQELVYIANAGGRKFKEPFTFFMVTLVIYLILTAFSELALRKVERKYSVGVRRA